ncbi:heterogeneous nuclear ribonucleoprotein F [Cocos nucifera]|uniref:Heterogeneous nuclear ribonucleoprotein F n=1 Tax=Cocos nucifera TaxID=13894 RepID=A0A8K0IC64_COCNU|nr:heterogeneous nuclear ribonucleoprotein F [Cocos nucifera]
MVAHKVQELTSFEVAQEINELDDHVHEETMVSILVEKGMLKFVETPKHMEVHAATRKYMDGGDGREMGLKRPQFDSSPSFFGASAGSSLMYNPSYAYAGQPPPFPVVRLRGLPFDCSEADVIDFFHGLDILDILFVHKGGRFSGEAFCVLAYPLQVDFAIQRNRQNMGRRYIEVFRSKRQEYYSAVAHEVSDMRGGSPRRSAPRARSADDGKDLIEHTGVLRMRGLPYSAGKDDVMDFFKDYELLEDHVHIVLNSDGRPTGEAFVEFANAEDSKSAMGRDRMTLGSRYIELFPSTPKEMDDAISRGR